MSARNDIVFKQHLYGVSQSFTLKIYFKKISLKPIDQDIRYGTINVFLVINFAQTLFGSEMFLIKLFFTNVQHLQYKAIYNILLYFQFFCRLTLIIAIPRNFSP